MCEKPSRLQDLTDGPLVVRNPEALDDNALQIDPPPAYDAMHIPVRPGLDKLRDLRELLRRETGDGLPPWTSLSKRPSGPCSLNRWTQSRSVCRL